ncbi:MAG: hypothetical protein IH989_08845, partial [Planctomycetes bacterium]|nr:hypothetical protein [Planctomycetota bacterium]
MSIDIGRECVIKLRSRPESARAAAVVILGLLFAGALTAADFDADGAEADKRRTAYRYQDALGESTSVLTEMAAVLPGHAGGIAAYDQIDWAAVDGSIQITHFGYDADVWDSSG